jgi:Protein of unknown function (DUF5672)
MYTAIIIEPRKHRALSYVLNNILTNLSNDWNVVVCHGTQNAEFVNNIISSDLSTYRNRITLRNLGVDNLDLIGYNKLLTTKSFYDYIPTEMFLVFQTDSIIISRYAHLINSFLRYDYVGAPWIRNKQVGNGGFSLRRKSKMLEIIEKVPYSNGKNEDEYFSLSPIPMYKPTFDEAKLFSVETVFNEVSFGCHKPWNHEGRLIVSLYPEIQTLLSLQ